MQFYVLKLYLRNDAYTKEMSIYITIIIVVAFYLVFTKVVRVSYSMFV